jgi:hypothetical protein
MVCAEIMRKRAFLPIALVLFPSLVGAAACGSSDDTSGQPGNSTIDGGADGTTTGDAATTDAPGDVALPDAALDTAANPDVSVDAATGAPDAAKEASVGAPEPTPEAGPADATSDASPDATLVADGASDAPAPVLGLDACSLPDGGIPDLALNDRGATTTSCLACIDANCATEAAACNGDCACAGDIIALFVCAASGQSTLACVASGTPNAAFTSLAVCADVACGGACGIQ